jgi:amino acid transporter
MNAVVLENVTGLAILAAYIIMLIALWRLARYLPSRSGWIAFTALIVLLIFIIISDPIIIWLVSGTPDGKPTKLHEAIYAFTAYIGPSIAALIFSGSLLRACFVATRPNQSFKRTAAPKYE